MSTKEKKHNEVEADEVQKQTAEQTNEKVDEALNECTEDNNVTPEEQITMLQEEVEKQKKEYLFLMADFDNFRKRVAKEKIELMKNAKGQVLEEMLPIVDDFERGLKAAADTDNAQAVKEGMELIYNKLVKYLEKNGVVAMVSNGEEFNDSYHEAITTIPAPEEGMKGKIIDTIQKGYMVNDKVLRYAKVVVAN